MKMMKITFVAFSLFCFFTTGFQFSVYAEQELTARQIMERAENEHKTRDKISVMNMEIRRGKSRRVRKLKMWVKTDDENNDKSLIRFQWPPEVKGTGFLTIEYSDRDDDQWLYLPALKKVRRIASSGKSGSFMGSDFTYADIGSGKIDNYRYKLVGSEVIDGKDCYIIEAIPTNEQIKKDEGYSKKIIWVRKDIFFAIQLKYYDRHGKYLKIMKQDEIKKIEDADVWLATKIIMSNAQKKGNETVMTLNEVEVNTGIADDFFTQRYLIKE